MELRSHGDADACCRLFLSKRAGPSLKIILDDWPRLGRIFTSFRESKISALVEQDSGQDGSSDISSSLARLCLQISEVPDKKAENVSKLFVFFSTKDEML